MKNILIVGSGGREHSLSWKLQQSRQVSQISVAPGNGGTKVNVPIQSDDIKSLIRFAKEKRSLIVVGLESPLANGIVNEAKKENLDIFAPTREAAEIEYSKVWAKGFMRRNSIPTAGFEVFEDSKDAKEYVKTKGVPLVVKVDGLADGKGVFVCHTNSEANDAIDRILTQKAFGEAGKRIIIEEKLTGVEVSYIVISDGISYKPMVTSQDHKRIYDGDKGPNTGGMGAYSPVPMVDNDLDERIRNEIIGKTIISMKNEGRPFVGFLYAGLMLTKNGPYVLEFNARMGDPEAQAIIPRMKSDLYPYLRASIDGTLSQMPPIEWINKYSVCITLASKGYPLEYPKNEEIKGLEVDGKDLFIFHGGTKVANGVTLTNGGRVLYIVALENELEKAAENAYRFARKISWPSRYMRTDIASKGIDYLLQS